MKRIILATMAAMMMLGAASAFAVEVMIVQPQDGGVAYHGEILKVIAVGTHGRVTPESGFKVTYNDKCTVSNREVRGNVIFAEVEITGEEGECIIRARAGKSADTIRLDIVKD